MYVYICIYECSMWYVCNCGMYVCMWYDMYLCMYACGASNFRAYCHTTAVSELSRRCGQGRGGARSLQCRANSIQNSRHVQVLITSSICWLSCDMKKSSSASFRAPFAWVTGGGRTEPHTHHHPTKSITTTRDRHTRPRTPHSEQDTRGMPSRRR